MSIEIKRILVFGGRDFTNKDLIYKVLDAANKAHVIEYIISGMAKGVDTIAANWANENGIHLLKFPAEWDKYGKSAGILRNQQMLDVGKPNLAFEFPGGKGTKDMSRRARKAGVVVLKVNDTLI